MKLEKALQNVQSAADGNVTFDDISYSSEDEKTSRLNDQRSHLKANKGI